MKNYLKKYHSIRNKIAKNNDLIVTNFIRSDGKKKAIIYTSFLLANFLVFFLLSLFVFNLKYCLIFSLLLSLSLTPLLFLKPSKPYSIISYFKFLFDVLFISFTVYSTLCFVRICFALPSVINTDKKWVKEEYQGFKEFNDNIIIGYHLEFLSSFSMIIVILFLILRLFLNLFDIVDELSHIIDKWKAIWKTTVISWGVLFTLLTTIAILINGAKS